MSVNVYILLRIKRYVYRNQPVKVSSYFTVKIENRGNIFNKKIGNMHWQMEHGHDPICNFPFQFSKRISTIISARRLVSSPTSHHQLHIRPKKSIWRHSDWTHFLARWRPEKCPLSWKTGPTRLDLRLAKSSWLDLRLVFGFLWFVVGLRRPVLHLILQFLLREKEHAYTRKNIWHWTQEACDCLILKGQYRHDQSRL